MFWNLVGVTAMFETADLLFVFGRGCGVIVTWLILARHQSLPGTATSSTRQNVGWDEIQQ